MTKERKNTPFLQQVAEHYTAQGVDLSNYCFVFPNRRSTQFFNNYLAQSIASNQNLQPGRKTELSPQVCTITDFVADITGDLQATPIELIFTLYNAYKTISHDDEYEFDRFLFWGNIILSDYNDVDMYLANPEAVFRNTRELREIATDYMTPELKQLVEQFFKVRLDETDEDVFWKTFAKPGEGDEVQARYLELWQQLYPLYVVFNKQLEGQGLSYNGKSLKKALDKIKEMAQADFEYDRYVMVGFNMLSNSELGIFKSLKEKGMAEFCWDYASPAFADEANKATLFMSHYVKAFPSAIMPEPATGWPSITAIGVPSNVGQAKYAFNVVDRLIDEHMITNVNNAIDTAIVLPDESLLQPLLNSVSSRVPKINVTLGYPLRESDIVSLMHIVAKMHSQAWRKKGEEEYTFFRDDVKCVLSHPVVKSLFGSEVTKAISEIDNKNIYNIPESFFDGYSYCDLFKTISEHDDQAAAINYIEHLKTFVKKVDELSGEAAQPAVDDENAESKPMSLQSAFIAQYIDVLNEVQGAIEQYGIPMCEYSIFYLIDRLTGMYTIPFEGEPLAGLQVMGMLETRCLDFKNLVMLSMNERIFPRKFFTSSFIPVNLRRAFNMSTTEHQESMTAYYFYRLMSRAENVYLLYDTSDKAVGSGEYSRFITQLEKLYHVNIHFKQLTTSIKPSSSLKIEIKKNEDVATVINEYSSEEGDRKFSASSIKELIRCPLKFYLHHIEGLNEENNDSEFIDAATFGSIVHDTLQQLYYPDNAAKTENGHYIVTTKAIENYKKNELERNITRNTNKIYLHKPDEQLNDELTGDAYMVKDAMRIFVENVLNYDIRLLKEKGANHFEIFECEQQHDLYLDMPDAEHKFNFTYRIDRVDKVGGDGPLRIIDYKTGNDDTAFGDVSSLFSPKNPRKLAIMQLYIYCNAYNQEYPGEQQIQPVIYKIKKMDDSGVKHSTGRGRANDEVVDYRQDELNVDFVNQMDTLMGDFFNLDKPFRQCDENQSNPPCQYCKFVEFCRR